MGLDITDQRAICRGFWDRFGHRQGVLRMAARLGIVQEVS